MQDFKEAGLPQPIFHRLENIGYTVPTPIQAETLPHALQGRDVLGTAQTGTGKTAAFGIPLVVHLLHHTKRCGLVLLPTRELAAQVMKALRQFIGRSNIQTALLIGGESMQKQLGCLKGKPRLIVGTPGRINDHIARGSLALSTTDFLVLDEVDRMLDMGFGVQLDRIIEHLSLQRQTLMFSATLPSAIESLSQRYLQDPIRISVGDVFAPAADVTQEQVMLTQSEKYPRLLTEIKARSGSIIIFIKTKHGADRMARKISQSGFKSQALHGDLRQNKRNHVIAGFRNQDYRILVATDVAARGLDIPHIEHVINYDLPQCPEDYIHRIGRTARAGKEGHALSFLSSDDAQKWRAIERLMDPDAKMHAGEAKAKPKRNIRKRRRHQSKKATA